MHQYISYKPNMAKRPKTDVYSSHLGFLEKAPGDFWDFVGIHKGGKEDTSLKISAFYNFFPPTYLMLLHYIQDSRYLFQILFRYSNKILLQVSFNMSFGL